MPVHPLWIVGLLVLSVMTVAVVLLIVWTVRAASKNAYPISASPAQMNAQPPPPARETPQEILARRFASGEITAAEYERARGVLRAGPKT